MINVAFVGCGSVQQEHCNRLAGMDGVAIVGHSDPVAERAEQAAARFGGHAYAGHDALFAKTRPDAVYIGVPPYAHGPIEEAAIARGIHLFVEKPLALERTTAKRIDGAVRKSKIIAAAGAWMRYHDTVREARQFLRGKGISLITGYCICPLPETGWSRSMEQSGGQFHERAAHVVDLLRYLCGEVAEVYAVAATGCMTNVHGYDVHDSSVAAIRLKSGAVATIAASCVSSNECRVGLEIVTPEATLGIDESGTLEIREPGRITRIASESDALSAESSAFLDAVRNGKRNSLRCAYNDAYRTFLVTCAANESMKSGLPVKP